MQTRSVLVPHLNIDKDVGMLIIPRILAFIFILFISLVGLRSQSAEQIPKDCIITKTIMTLFIPLRYNFSDRCSVPVLCLIWFLWSTRRLITKRHIWRLVLVTPSFYPAPVMSSLWENGNVTSTLYFYLHNKLRIIKTHQSLYHMMIV